MPLDLTPDQVLRWYIDAGIDETMGDMPIDRFAASARPVAPPPPAMARTPPLAAAVAPPALVHQSAGTAAHIAAGCATLAELRAALEAFDGLALRQSANSTVFADGNPEASVMCIGEAPGQDEDRQGLPFVGPAGKLLDRMLASIGLDRSTAYMTNVLPWRPPANRKPSHDEMAACLPFLTRHIELVDPQVLVLFGGTVASALLARHDGINRLRGRWFEYSSPGLPRPVSALATFHPAYLLGTPEAKRGGWRDILMIKRKLLAVTH
jgi:DNA polymerase